MEIMWFVFYNDCREQDPLLDVAGDSTAMLKPVNPSILVFLFLVNNHCHSGHVCLSDSEGHRQNDNPVSLNNSKVKISQVLVCLSPELMKPVISFRFQNLL